MYAIDLYIGMELEYSDEYVEAWQSAYLEGREEWETFQSIREYMMRLVGLTQKAGLVVVEHAGNEHGVNVRTIHVDNVQAPTRNVGDEDA